MRTEDSEVRRTHNSKDEEYKPLFFIVLVSRKFIMHLSSNVQGKNSEADKN